MRKPLFALVLLVVFVFGVGTVVRAQGNPFTTLEQTIASLVDAVADLTTTVDDIAGAVAPGNTLVTSSLIATSGEDLSCTALNKSGSQRNVTIELYRIGDGEKMLSRSQNLAPGRGFGWSLGAATLSWGYCKIIVNDGSKDDVRANLMVVASTGSNVRSVVPAE